METIRHMSTRGRHRLTKAGVLVQQQRKVNLIVELSLYLPLKIDDLM